MDIVVDVLVKGFNLFIDNTLLDIPYLVWFLLPPVIGIVIKFIQGKK